MNGKINNIENKRVRYRDMLFDYLNRFTYFESLMTFIIASVDTQKLQDKIDITESKLSKITVSQKFKLFENLIKTKKINRIENIEPLFTDVNSLRNHLAHSYFLPDKNNNTDNNITLTNLKNSDGIIISYDDFDDRSKKLELLILSVDKIICDNKFDEQT